MIPIYVLISTIDDGICHIRNVLLPKADGVRYVVSWQQTKGKDAPAATDGHTEAVAELKARPDVVLTTLEGRGLCRNRNHAVQTAINLLEDPLQDAIFVLADDDESFLPDAFLRVRDIYERHARVDAILLRTRNKANSELLKRYPEQPIPYQERPRWYYPSSVELTFRARLWQTGIRFDERFGLGSPRLSAGEEEVFLADALDKGLNVMVFPSDLCATDPATTGSSPLDVKMLRSKGAVYGRLLSPWRAYLRAWREALSIALRHRHSFLPVFRNICYGIKYIRS